MVGDFGLTWILPKVDKVNRYIQVFEGFKDGSDPEPNGR
jgi:hypothetical protein